MHKPEPIPGIHFVSVEYRESSKSAPTLDVEVASTPKRVGHIAIGFADFDKLMYGGIPPTYAVH